MPSSDWNWHDESSKESTVVPSVDAIAVYTNPHGDIVLRQQARFGDDDPVIVIPRSLVRQVTKALTEEAKKSFEPDEG